MEPTLVAGQGLLATPFGSARPGQIRVFEHPHRPGFWLVKRVDAVDDDSMLVVSDNPDAPGAVDSSVLGPVRVAGSLRVVARIPRRWM